MADSHYNQTTFKTGDPAMALPTPAGATLLALLHQFEESEWWPPEVIREHQRRQLRSLVRYAVDRVPFYGGGDAAPKHGPDEGGIPDLGQWSRLPVLTREDVQDHYDALQSTGVPNSHGRVLEARTSGSTGRPVRVRSTKLAHTLSGVCSLRAHRWHRRDLGGRLAAVHIDPKERADYPAGLQQPGWGWPASEVYRTGPAALLSLRTPIAHQVEWLQRQDPDYLLSCPSNLLALAEHCIETGARFPQLRDVATIMEVVSPALREACRRAWNAPVIDMYTSREAGCIAVQCPDHEHYHVMTETVLVEILDDDGEPCGPGETGRVVVTPLHNYAMPLLRYELGDYAEVGDPCPCGRGLPVLRRILGRVRNMLVLPDGTRRWPSFNRRKLFACAPIRQVQFVQKFPGKLDIRLSTDRPLTAGEEAGIRRVVAARLPCPFEIALTYVAGIERSAGGKFEDFISEVEPAFARW